MVTGSEVEKWFPGKFLDVRCSAGAPEVGVLGTVVIVVTVVSHKNSGRRMVQPDTVLEGPTALYPHRGE